MSTVAPSKSSAVLRRSQRIVLSDDDETPQTPFVPEPAVATGPPPDRRNLEQWLSEVERAAEKQPKADRRGLEALRAEVQRTLVTADGEVISGPGTAWRALLKPSRLALLAVALIAGAVAAYFAVQDQAVPPPTPAVVVEQPAPEPELPAPPPAPQLQVLVARQAIGLGERLTPQMVEWKAWPVEGAREDFIALDVDPLAPENMSGSIARYEFFPGEPIRRAKLAAPGDGYLSAVLAPGELGVAIPVNPDSAAGGFIQPNDHVDVLLTRAIEGRQVSETVLSNVRVLAVAHRLGDVGAAPATEEDAPEVGNEQGKAPATFSEQQIATLALDRAEAEIITAARVAGSLSLVLRSVSDFAASADPGAELTANQKIRLTSPFWAP